MEISIPPSPLLGKQFSWFCLDGQSMSRIDRFLLSENLIARWKITAQRIGDIDISDYCSVWLLGEELSWGLKPFKFNNYWLKHEEFKSFVEECWGSFQITGTGSFVIKEKLKKLKERLRWWKKEVFGILDPSIEKIVKELNEVEEAASKGVMWTHNKSNY